MKQDRIMPIFQCQVVETINSQYYNHWSTGNIRFREPTPLEAWEYRQSRVHRKVVLSGHTIQTTISHAIFLSRNLDDNSNCEAGVTTFQMWRQMEGRLLRGVWNHTGEEFAKMIKLTGKITLSSGVRAQTIALWTVWRVYSGVELRPHGLPSDDCAALQMAHDS